MNKPLYELTEREVGEELRARRKDRTEASTILDLARKQTKRAELRFSEVANEILLRKELKKRKAKARRLAKSGVGQICLQTSPSIWVDPPHGIGYCEDEHGVVIEDTIPDPYDDNHFTESCHYGDTAEQVRAWGEAIERLETYRKLLKAARGVSQL
tara:strand:- start:107 stop:574 length:468 start_codon:yes stop_codon:yes gene_type:complete